MSKKIKTKHKQTHDRNKTENRIKVFWKRFDFVTTCIIRDSELCCISHGPTSCQRKDAVSIICNCFSCIIITHNSWTTEKWAKDICNKPLRWIITVIANLNTYSRQGQAHAGDYWQHLWTIQTRWLVDRTSILSVKQQVHYHHITTTAAGRETHPGTVPARRTADYHRTYPVCLPLETHCWSQSQRSWCWGLHQGEGSPPVTPVNSDKLLTALYQHVRYFVIFGPILMTTIQP